MFRAELARFDPALLSGDDCRVLAEELARTEKACAAARARSGARVTACGSYRGGGYGDAAEWMARTSGSSRGEAAAELKTAEALEGSCPETKEALASGELSLAQASEITRTEKECPGSESELVAVAKSSGLATLKDQGRKRRLQAVAAEELAARQRRARSYRHWIDELGMVRFSGALEPLVSIALMHRLDAECDRIRREARRGGSDEPWEAHAADTLAKMLSGQATGPARRADVVVVCDLRAYRRGQHAEEEEACHIVGASPVPVSVVRDLVDGDAFVKAVTHDGVRIDTVVHFGRHISAELRTALELGKPPGFEGVRCAEAGCERRWSTEWDHVDPVANGGATSFANLEGRCAYPCHKDKTERDRKAGLLGNRGVGGDGDWHDDRNDSWCDDRDGRREAGRGEGRDEGRGKGGGGDRDVSWGGGGHDPP